MHHDIRNYSDLKIPNTSTPRVASPSIGCDTVKLVIFFFSDGPNNTSQPPSSRHMAHDDGTIPASTSIETVSLPVAAAASVPQPLPAHQYLCPRLSLDIIILDNERLVVFPLRIHVDDQDEYIETDGFVVCLIGLGGFQVDLALDVAELVYSTETC
ncbi:hypothetical protein ACVBEG_27790 [Pseudomonas sp. GG8]